VPLLPHTGPNSRGKSGTIRGKSGILTATLAPNIVRPTNAILFKSAAECSHSFIITLLFTYFQCRQNTETGRQRPNAYVVCHRRYNTEKLNINVRQTYLRYTHLMQAMTGNDVIIHLTCHDW